MTDMIEKPPVPESVEALTREIQNLIESVDFERDGAEAAYNRCVEVMAQAGYLVVEFAARALHATGFQHSAASLGLLGMLRNYKGPYATVNIEESLYPQCDIVNRVEDFRRSAGVRIWLADEAQRRLDADTPASPTVLAHWRRLIADRPTHEETE